MQNPTHSFKDRGSIIEVSKAIEYGYDEVVCASTGNMAYSLAYYAKIHGIKSKVFIAGGANRDKLRDIRETHDADITKVRGDFTKAQALAIRYCQKRMNAFLSGDYCYRKEGQKTIAYELMATMKGIEYIFVPVGNATLLSGMLKALEQIKKDTNTRIPRIVAVQSRECSPFVDAFNDRRKLRYQRPRTKADAIAVGLPTYGEIAAAELRKNRGVAISIPDSELVREQKEFYKKYGMIVELASVTGIAAFKKLNIDEDKKCVAVITGGNV